MCSTLEALAYGTLFAAFFATISTYVGTNFGMGFSFGVVTIMTVYAALETIDSPNKRLISMVYVTSTNMLTVHWLIGTRRNATRKIRGGAAELARPS